MITKEDIEEIFNRYPSLQPPERIYILDAPVIAQVHNTQVLLKGSRPLGENAIFLSEQADEWTVIHETIHTYGFGEPMANFGTWLAKQRERVPNIRNRMVRYRERQIDFEEISEYGFRKGKGTPSPVLLLELEEA